MCILLLYANRLMICARLARLYILRSCSKLYFISLHTKYDWMQHVERNNLHWIKVSFHILYFICVYWLLEVAAVKFNVHWNWFLFPRCNMVSKGWNVWQTTIIAYLMYIWCVRKETKAVPSSRPRNLSEGAAMTRETCTNLNHYVAK